MANRVKMSVPERGYRLDLNLSSSDENKLLGLADETDEKSFRRSDCSSVNVFYFPDSFFSSQMLKTTRLYTSISLLLLFFAVLLYFSKPKYNKPKVKSETD